MFFFLYGFFVSSSFKSIYINEKKNSFLFFFTFYIFVYNISVYYARCSIFFSCLRLLLLVFVMSLRFCLVLRFLGGACWLYA